MSSKIDERDWCPHCEAPAPTLKTLADHMRKAHKRLVLDRDINKARAARARRLQALAAEEDALFA